MTVNIHGARVRVVGAQVLCPERVALDITDDASVEAYFAVANPFDHVIIAAAQTKTGPVADLTLPDAQAVKMG